MAVTKKGIASGSQQVQACVLGPRHKKKNPQIPEWVRPHPKKEKKKEQALLRRD